MFVHCVLWCVVYVFIFVSIMCRACMIQMMAVMFAVAEGLKHAIKSGELLFPTLKYVTSKRKKLATTQYNQVLIC